MLTTQLFLLFRFISPAPFCFIVCGGIGVGGGALSSRYSPAVVGFFCCLLLLLVLSFVRNNYKKSLETITTKSGNHLKQAAYISDNNKKNQFNKNKFSCFTHKLCGPLLLWRCCSTCCLCILLCFCCCCFAIITPSFLFLQVEIFVIIADPCSIYAVTSSCHNPPTPKSRPERDFYLIWRAEYLGRKQGAEHVPKRKV